MRSLAMHKKFHLHLTNPRLISRVMLAYYKKRIELARIHLEKVQQRKLMTGMVTPHLQN